MLEVIASGLLTGWAIALPVGAVAALLVSVSARYRWRVGAAAGLGIATVDGAYSAIAVLGGSALAGAVEPVAGPLRLASAAVLMAVAAVIGWRAVRHGSDDPTTSRTPPTAWSAYATFVAITAVNPATVVYFVAVVLGNRHLADTAARGLVFVLAAFAASASWQLALATGGAGLGRVATGPRGRRATGLVSAVVVAGLAVRTLVA